MQNIRAVSKAEKQFYNRTNLQQCVVCGRWFCRRKDNVCSIACSEKADEIR
jgi:hypothetical protein